MRLYVALVMLAACEGATVDAGPESVTDAACAGALASPEVADLFPHDAPDHGDDGRIYGKWRGDDKGPTVVCENVQTSNGTGTLDLVGTWHGRAWDDPDVNDGIDGNEWFDATIVVSWRDLDVVLYDQGWALDL